MSVFAEFALPVTAFPAESRLAGTEGVSVELERVVPTGSVTHYLWITSSDNQRAVRALTDDESVESVRVLDELPDRTLVRVVWSNEGTPVFDFVEEHGAILAGATGDSSGWTVTLRFPDQTALSGFYESCRSEGIALELRGINEVGFGHDDDGIGLTEAQSETVVAAFEAGYFDIPRRTTLEDLSDELGVSEQAVSERLRRGITKFLETVLPEDDEPDTSGSDRSR